MRDSPKPSSRGSVPDAHGGMHGVSPGLLRSAERLLERLNSREDGGDYSVQRKQLTALIKVLRDPLFQDVYRANLEVDKELAESRARKNAGYDETDAVAVRRTTADLNSAPSSDFFNEQPGSSAVSGFVKTEESIEEFVRRKKGSRRVLKVHFYREPGVSLGFSVSGYEKLDERDERGMIVDDVTTNGFAHRQGIRKGDQILVVNKVLLKSEADHADALDILKSTGRIEVVLAQDTHNMTRVSHQKQVHRMSIRNDVNGGMGFGIRAQNDRIIVETVVPGSAAAIQGRLLLGDEIDRIGGTNIQGMSVEDIQRLLKLQTQPEIEFAVRRRVPVDTPFFVEGLVYDVTLEKDDRGLGITIASPVDESSQDGVVIKGIVPQSVADRLDIIEPEDRIIVVNGHNIFDLSGDAALAKLKNAGNVVHLTLLRNNKDDPAFSDNLLTAQIEAMLVQKWSRRLGPRYDIIAAEISKNDKNTGLGISLEGVSETRNGNEFSRHYLRTVIPTAPVGESGKFQNGDELLEVNGHEIYGINHAEVVNILRNVPSKILMIAARLKPEEDQMVTEVPSETLSPTSSAETSEVRESSRELPERMRWSKGICNARVTKDAGGLGLSLVTFEGESGERHVVVDHVVPGGAAERGGQVALYDKLIRVQNLNVQGKSLQEIVMFVTHLPLGTVTFGIRKFLGDDIPDEEEEPAREPVVEEDIAVHQSSHLRAERGSTPTFENSRGQRWDSSAGEVVRQRTPEEDVQQTVAKRTEMLRQSQEDLSTIGQVSTITNPQLGDERWKRLPSELCQSITVSKANIGVVGLSIAREQWGNGMLVKSTLKGGAVQRDGRVQVGDILVSLNHTNVRSMDVNDVRALLREQGRHEGDVTLGYIAREDAERYWGHGEVNHPLTVKPSLYVEGAEEYTSPTKPTGDSLMTPFGDSIRDEPSVDHQSQYRPGNPFLDTPGVTSQDEDQFVFGPKRLVEIEKQDNEPLGLSILGHEMGIFIKALIPNSPAALSGEDGLSPGDRVLSVNGVDLTGADQQGAVLAIKAAKSPLRFIVQSCTVRGGDHSETLFSSIN